jgi:hypothetical protein
MAVLDLPVATLLICLAGLLWVLLLNHAYGRKLGDKPRTSRRAKGDKAIARQVAISYITPSAIALAALAIGKGARPNFGVITITDIQVFFAIASVMLLSWLASSHVDWYYIRPRIDGVVVAPPCQTSRDVMWKGVTRKWYLHRAIASAVTGGAVIAVALLVGIALGEQWPKALAELGGFAAIFTLGALLLRGEWQNFDSTVAMIREPLYWLGDDLRYETDMWKERGFVLHVAIPVTKLVPLEFDSGVLKPDPTPVTESASLLTSVRRKSSRLAGCGSAAECKALNPECVFYEKKDVPGRKRLLVL